MTSDDDLIARGCPAFENDVQKCATYKGRAMRVVKTYPESRKVELWVPTLPVEKNPVFVPVFLLEVKTPKFQTLVIPAGVGDADIRVNTVNHYIYNVQPRASAVGVPTNQYIVKVNAQKFTPNRWQQVSRSGIQFTMTVSDQEVGPRGKCEDRAGWKDADGDNCNKYRDDGWCNANGEQTSNFKGQRCWLLFSCSTTMHDKSGREGSADEACCACGGGFWTGGNDYMTEAPTPPPETEAPTPAPVSSSVVPPGNPPKQVFVMGGDDAFPEHMGLFKLNVWKADDGMGDAIYENVRKSVMYFDKAKRKWMIADNDRLAVLEAPTTTAGTNPEFEALPRDSAGIAWSSNGTTVQLVSRHSDPCGLTSDCHCPDPEYECKADVADLYCYPGQIMQPICGTRESCCSKKQVCDAPKWADLSSPNEQNCGFLMSPKDGNDYQGPQYCPASGCTRNDCCFKNCLSECGSNVNATNQLAVCPPAGCDRQKCCKNAQAAPGSPTPAPVTKDYIPCEECMGSDPAEKEKQVVLTEVTINGLKYEKLNNNYAVRTDIYTAIRKATLDSVQQVKPGLLTDGDIVIHVGPDDAGTTSKSVVQIICVPQGAKIQATIQAMNTAADPEVGKLTQNIEENIRDVPKRLEVSEKVVLVDRGDQKISAEERTAVHERRVAQDATQRGGFSMWTSYGSAAFREWGIWAKSNWYFLAAGLVVVGSAGFATTWWLNSDNDEDHDVVG